MLAAYVEGIKQLENAFKPNRPVDTLVDAPTDLHGREILAEDSRDKRGRRRHDVRHQPLGIHLAHILPDKIGKLLRNRVVAVAVAVVKRIELDAVRPRPAEIGDHPRAKLRREVRRGSAAEHARPREKRLPDAPQMLRTRRLEISIEKMSYRQNLTHTPPRIAARACLSRCPC